MKYFDALAIALWWEEVEQKLLCAFRLFFKCTEV